MRREEHHSLTHPLSLRPLTPPLPPSGVPEDRPGEGEVGSAAFWGRTAPGRRRGMLPRYAQIVWL